MVHYFKQVENFKKYSQDRIMVVDDEEFCIATMKAMLKRAGIDTKYQVDFCITGQEALNQIHASTSLGFSYGLIFTDISMPVMDGIQST